MLSEIDRTKTFVLIKSFPDHSFHEVPIIFRLESRNKKIFLTRGNLITRNFIIFTLVSLSLSLPRLSIKGKKNWISGFRDWQRVFRFNDEFLVLGKNCVKCFCVANSNTFFCKFSKMKFLKKSKANNNQIFQFHQNIVLIFSETLQLDSN